MQFESFHWLKAIMASEQCYTMLCKYVKGEGHPKKPSTFKLSSPIASKHSVFVTTKVSAYEVPTILKKYILKEVALEATILKLSLQPGHVYAVMSFCLTQNWSGKERNLQLTWHPSQGQQYFLFSKGLSTPLSPMLSFQGLKHVWLKIM